MSGASQPADLTVVEDPAPQTAAPPSTVELIQRSVRFLLPPHARVAVITDGRSLLHLEGRQTWPLPRTRHGIYAGPYPRNDNDAIAQIEAVRAEGAQFLLIPKDSLWWLDYYDGLRRHLATSYRVVFRDEERCMIIALHHEEDMFSEEGAPDGLALPSPELMAMTTGVYWGSAFWNSGEITSRAIRKILTSNGLDIGAFGSILDFGCGCGRVMRHWKDLPARIAGADYNPYLVRWCRLNLRFAEFQRVHELQPLTHEKETFDFIYSYSVFTHLDQQNHDFWIAELQRMLKPGGVMYLTFRGQSYADNLSPEERQRFDAGEMVVQLAEISGSNACLAHHPESYVRETIAEHLDVLDYVPADATDHDDRVALDGVLFRKP